MPRGVYLRAPTHWSQRFLAKFSPGAPDECWNWAGAKGSNGYGQLRFGNSVKGAHRLAYEHFVRPLLSAEVIDHLCRNPSCVNPAHLEPVSMAENTARGLLSSVVAAKATRKTRCKRGHPLFGKNLILTSSGRGCRTCQKAKVAEWREANRERVNEMQRRRRAAVNGELFSL